MRARYELEYAALAAFATVARALPRAVALALGAAVGELGWLLRVRRRLVLANLAQALPERTAADRRAVGARAARNFGRTVVEFVRFAGSDRARVDRLIEFEGLDALRSALDEGRGAIVVTAHLGSWALYVTALAAARIPSALLVGRQHNPKVDRFILDIPGDAVRFISKGRTAPRDVLRCLRENRAVVMVADQDAGEQGTLAPFLGRLASTLSLPGALAARHGTPIVVMAGHRIAGGRHVVSLSRLEREVGAAADVTATFNAALGRAIRVWPEQYFWYHRRWRDYTAAEGQRARATASVTIPSSASAAPTRSESGR